MSKKKTIASAVEPAKPAKPLVKKVIGVIAKITQIILTAPLYLPPKLLQAVKYLALVAGLVKATSQNEAEDE